MYDPIVNIKYDVLTKDLVFEVSLMQVNVDGSISYSIPESLTVVSGEGPNSLFNKMHEFNVSEQGKIVLIRNVELNPDISYEARFGIIHQGKTYRVTKYFRKPVVV